MSSALSYPRGRRPARELARIATCISMAMAMCLALAMGSHGSAAGPPPSRRRASGRPAPATLTATCRASLAGSGVRRRTAAPRAAGYSRRPLHEGLLIDLMIKPTFKPKSLEGNKIRRGQRELPRGATRRMVSFRSCPWSEFDLGRSTVMWCPGLWPALAHLLRGTSVRSFGGSSLRNRGVSVRPWSERLAGRRQ